MAVPIFGHAIFMIVHDKDDPYLVLPAVAAAIIFASISIWHVMYIMFVTLYQLQIVKVKVYQMENILNKKSYHGCTNR